MGLKNKKGQEEIVGFVIIVVIVSIILLFFLIFSLQSDRGVGESREASSFLQAALSYTSTCEDNGEFLALEDLVVSCYREERCDNEEYTCDVLNDTLSDMLAESWIVGEESRVIGYKIKAVSGTDTILSISEGNATNNYKGAQQILPETVAEIKITFTAYS